MVILMILIGIYGLIEASKSKFGYCDRSSAKLYFIETGKGGGDFEHMHIVCECCKDQIGASEHNNLSGIEQGSIQKCDGWSLI